MSDSGHRVETILVCVDGSSNSLDAVRWAAGLAAALGAEVVAVHALGLLDRLEPDGPLVPTQPHREEIAEQLRTDWIAPLEETGVTHRCVLHDGNAVDVVLRAIDEVAADLVVLGSRGVGGSPALLLGSTSTQVAQRATRPVTIVPSTERASAG